VKKKFHLGRIYSKIAAASGSDLEFFIPKMDEKIPINRVEFFIPLGKFCNT
jgi:hypothetical protein